MTTTILWLYSFGQGMVVGIFGIATGSMGITYASIQDNALFASALKKVMIMVILLTFAAKCKICVLGLGYHLLFILYLLLDRCRCWNVH